MLEVIGISGYVSRYPTAETTLAVNSKAFHEMARHETREILVMICCSSKISVIRNHSQLLPTKDNDNKLLNKH